MADRCVYEGDFGGALCHALTANFIHDTLKDFDDGQRQDRLNRHQ
jgi:hypothetical protein